MAPSPWSSDAGSIMVFQYNAPPYQTLIAAFLAWKGLLLAIAAGSCVGPSYDTSGSLLLSDGPANQSVPTLVTRLTSWDAIYFIQNAKRGYLFEQEWAFGLGLPSLISSVVKGRSSCVVCCLLPIAYCPTPSSGNFSLFS